MDAEHGAGFFEVRVAAAETLTPRICMYELVGDGTPLPPFEAGAHLEVLTGAGVTRHYSIANDPAERHRYVLAVLREPDGVGSGWMHETLQPGATLTVGGPRNAFPLQEDASEHILVAGGVGITPIRSMALRLKSIGAKFRVIYCTRSPEETAFRDELAEQLGPALHLHHDHGDPAQSLDLEALLDDQPDGAHVYICGPRRMIDAARVATMFWPTAAVHVEVFASSAAKPKAAARNDPFEVELARSGRVLQIPADKSILEVLLAAGVQAPYVCLEGHCSNCRTGLISGLADHRDNVMEDGEKEAQDTIYVCVSRALPGERLVLDR